MKDEIKENFYSLEELKRTIDCYDGYLDNEEVYYFIGTLRFAYDYITNLQEELKSANESITWWSNRFNAVQEENEELKMTNLALADDITKNKIIKQEVLTECCGIPIGEIPMLKIQNDEYKTRNDKAIEYIKKHCDYGYAGQKCLTDVLYRYEAEELLEILQGKSDK